MLDLSVYILYRIACGLISALPLPFVFSLGKLAGAVAWLLLPGYRRLARRNLEIAFAGEKPASEVRALTRRHFRRLGANFLSGIKLSTMEIEEIAACVELENIESFHRELRAGRPVVLVLSHLGNWEVAAQLLPKHVGYVRASTVYQQLRNRRIDADIRQRRARTGLEMFDRDEGFRKPIELLRSGGVVGILSDQHAGDHGIWTPFFDRLASTTPLPALLAKRTGAAVMTAAAHTTGPGQWRITFTGPLNSEADSVASLTFRANLAIEEQIRRAPEDWFWVHNRWKTPRPNFLLGHYKRGIYLAPEYSADRLKPFRILIRSTNWLGDSVMSAPAVRAIKAGRPDAHLTIAAPAKIAAVWKLVPEVDAIITLEGKSLGKAVRAIRCSGPFDVGVLFPNSLRAALELWLADVPRRVGYGGQYRTALLNQLVRSRAQTGPPAHQANTYLRLAGSVGADTTAAQFTSGSRRAKAVGSQLMIGLCPGADYGPAKRWLPERFGAVAASLAARLDVDWLLFGKSDDAEIGAIIAGEIGAACTNLIGKTSLDELMRELQRCSVLLTNDTGTMHLAALLGVPVVALFGSTEPRLTGPLGAGHRIIRHQVECSPCFLRTCPIDFRCMKAISANEVVQAIADLIAEERAGAR